MTSLSDRLRGVIGGRVLERGAAPVPRPPVAPPVHDSIARVLDGEWHERSGQRFLVVDRRYVPGYRHGAITLADSLPPSDSAWPRLSLLTGGARADRLLFVDLETTGIAGGAGTYAFLVGCGWFDGGTFRVRQFFLSSFTAERALLEAVAEVAADAGTVVSYNGKSFDLPIIETRFALHRLPSPFAEMPHVDMLHPARHMWRGPGRRRSVGKDASCGGAEDAFDDDGRQDIPGACRLTTLEQQLCGYVREGDVAGFEIPARYFRFVHAGDPRPLLAVLEHNRLDLISLALVTARTAQLLEDGPAAARTAREALGMGRLYARGGMMAEAKSAFARAIELEQDDECLRAEALRAYALAARRLRQYDDAAEAWRRLLDLSEVPGSIEREASQALAVHLEHRQCDLASARDFALRLLNGDASPARRQAAEYRLARLDRKLGSRTAQPALAF